MVGKDLRRKEKALSQAHLKIYQRQVSRKKEQLKSTIEYGHDVDRLDKLEPLALLT